MLLPYLGLGAIIFFIVDSALDKMSSKVVELPDVTPGNEAINNNYYFEEIMYLFRISLYPAGEQIR